MAKRKGNQKPTTSFVLKYVKKRSKGPEAVEIYNKTGQTAMKWQEGLLRDIMAVNAKGLWVHTKCGYSLPRRNGKMGFKPKIVRKTTGHCCDWCSFLAGTYDYYPDMDRDVFRRHAHCRCTVEYVPDKSGRVQDVHTKQWKNTESKQLNTSLRFPLDIQFFGGKERRDRYQKNWQEASLSKAIDDLVPNAKIIEKKGKIRYESSYKLIYDKEGDYFRISSSQIKNEKGYRRYTDLNGEDVNYKIVDDEKRKLSDNNFMKLTHFKNIDNQGKK